ncbi:MAG: hypothetical protein AAGU74_10980 [Bacillota bacterium]
MNRKRFFCALLAAILILACLPVGTALAAADDFVNQQPIIVTAKSATAYFTLDNMTGPGKISLVSIKSPNNNFSVQFAPMEVDVGEMAAGTFTLTATDISKFAAYASGSGVPLTFCYYAGTDPLKEEAVSFPVYIATEAPSSDDENQGAKLSALVLDSTDLTGAVIPAPSGDAGDTITIRLPIKNRGNGSLSGATAYVTGAEIMPQLSSNLDEFPFEITELEYKRSLPDLPAGAKAVIEYQFKISKSATSGIKPVTFNAVYYVNGVAETTQFKVFVTVVKGATPSTGTDGKPIATSVPKVIIKSYQLDPEQLIAGQQFKLTMELLNTSATEAVKNLKITVKNDDGVILPASSGSNTLYVSKINKESTVTTEINLQSAPDIAAKAHILTVSFSYEGGTTLTSYDAVETLSLPITQPIRLKLGEPVIYGDAMLEQPASISFSLYNMGKSTVYNMMVDVEGDGLRMEEPYYGSNVTSGSNMGADFNVIPSVAGTISANIVVTYEDVYGKQYTEKVPFQLNVMENYVPEEIDPGKEGMNPEPQPAGAPILLIVGIAVGVAIIALIVITQVRKARRRRELEED